MEKPVQVTRASLPDFQEYLNEIKDLWDSHWITNMGIKHKQLEAELAEYLSADNIVLFSNGHLALESALIALDLKGEVITTPFTFASTTHAIVRCGLEPVFCDINDYNYTIDTQCLESLITAKTSAILPVHVYGHICDLEGIERIAVQHDLKVIYDAAHAFGIRFNGRGIAEWGDASILSFHATKVFNTIEGGAVLFNDPNLKKRLNHLKNFGISGPENVESIGGNAKMNEFQAAMGICNLRHIRKVIEQRRVVYERYTKWLNGIDGIKVSEIQPGISSNFAYFPVVFDGYKWDRDEIFEKLKSCGIYARKYFFPLANEFNCYAGRFDSEQTPTAKYISSRVLTLPLYPDLSLDDVDRICEIIMS